MAELNLDQVVEERAGEPHKVTWHGYPYKLRRVVPGGLAKVGREVLKVKRLLEGLEQDPDNEQKAERQMVAIDRGEEALKGFLKPFFIEREEWSRFLDDEPSIFDLMHFIDGILPLYDFEGGLGESQASGSSSPSDGDRSRPTSSASTGSISAPR
jgi:hypothetical protein